MILTRKYTVDLKQVLTCGDQVVTEPADVQVVQQWLDEQLGPNRYTMSRAMLETYEALEEAAMKYVKHGSPGTLDRLHTAVVNLAQAHAEGW